jgi:Domain of unknown function (DUF4259)
MGSWGPGPFDNDDALDFVGALRESTPSDIRHRLLAALDAVSTGGSPDATEVNIALAAAGLVAIRNGAPEPDETAVTEWLRHAPMQADPELCRIGLEAVDRALEPDDNEWYELWDEADSIDLVETALKPYRAALEAGTG